MPAKVPSYIWRVQRDQIYPDIMTCMVRAPRYSIHFYWDESWEQHLRGRSTIYVEALLRGTNGKPRLTIMRHVTEDDW